MSLNRLLTRLFQLFALRALWRATRPARRGPTQSTSRPGPARAQREAAKRARQAARITRRLGR